MKTPFKKGIGQWLSMAKDYQPKLNPPRGKPRGGFTVMKKIDFQFAR